MTEYPVELELHITCVLIDLPKPQEYGLEKHNDSRGWLLEEMSIPKHLIWCLVSGVCIALPRT